MKDGRRHRAEPKKPVNYRLAWREARRIVWAHRYRLGIGLGILLVSRIAGLALPAMSKYFVDEVIGNRRADLLPLMASIAGGAAIVHAGGSFLLARLIGVAAMRTITELRRKMHARIVRLPVGYYEDNPTGSILSRVMSDPEGIRNLVGTGFLQLVGGVVTAALALGVLLYLNAKLTLGTLGFLSFFLVVVVVSFRWLRPMYRENRERFAQANARLAESIAAHRVVKCYTAEKREEIAFTRAIHRFYRKVAGTITASAVVGSISILIIGAVSVMMLLVGGHAILSGSMTMGDLVMYLAFTAMLIGPIVRIGSISTSISDALAGLDRIQEVLQLDREDAADAEKPPLDAVRGEIVFENVGFEYLPGKPVLEGISFRAPAGSTTALVGPSGSGKSTLIGLVMLFHRPKAGTIYVDGRDLETVPLRDYRSHLGVVLQENFLFDGSVAENIRYGCPEAGRERVEEASRIAHCDEFVQALEHGYDTVVGERGVRLSGGQRQRIAIARAILADPSILILDEATSSLDSESEALIQDGLRNLRRGRTTFVIAHRLSTIQSADQILVLDGGRIRQRGTHEELMREEGLYKHLYERQHRLVADRFVNPGEEWSDGSPPPPESPDSSEDAALPVPEAGLFDLR